MKTKHLRIKLSFIVSFDHELDSVPAQFSGDWLNRFIVTGLRGTPIPGLDMVEPNAHANIAMVAKGKAKQ
jgi:hypothetical protein